MKNKILDKGLALWLCLPPFLFATTVSHAALSAKKISVDDVIDSVSAESEKARKDACSQALLSIGSETLAAAFVDLPAPTFSHDEVSAIVNRLVDEKLDPYFMSENRSWEEDESFSGASRALIEEHIWAASELLQTKLIDLKNVSEEPLKLLGETYEDITTILWETKGNWRARLAAKVAKYFDRSAARRLTKNKPLHDVLRELGESVRAQKQILRQNAHHLEKYRNFILFVTQELKQRIANDKAISTELAKRRFLKYHPILASLENEIHEELANEEELLGVFLSGLLAVDTLRDGFFAEIKRAKKVEQVTLSAIAIGGVIAAAEKKKQEASRIHQALDSMTVRSMKEAADSIARQTDRLARQQSDEEQTAQLIETMRQLAGLSNLHDAFKNNKGSLESISRKLRETNKQIVRQWMRGHGFAG